jgi:HAE1 family hydrophobic/amphiphilic exporter-1
VVGGQDREIRIWLRVDDLRALGITAEDVIDTLQKENVEFPGGRVESRLRELVVKTRGEVERVEDFSDLVITYRDYVPIRIGDVASVEDGTEDFRSLSRLNGQRAVSLLVRRQSGENLVAVAQAVRQRLDQLRAELPAGYDLVLAQDLSTFVSDSISEAQRELLRGGTLAVLVILLFLRTMRGALVAAITIPTTIIATYSFMLYMDFTINMMSMLALTISVWMIIDDSIVVLENSFRHMEEGKGRLEAAVAGISEIGFAVIATSLAIGAVFVPVAFMEGMVGQFFFEFGITVACAVAVSTFIAVTLSPMLCSRVLKLPNRQSRFYQFSERVFRGMETTYRKTLGLALKHRWLVASTAAGVFVASLFMTGLIGKEFIPPQDEGQFNIQVETPLGSSIHRTSRILAEIEERVRRLPGVTNIFTTVAAGSEGRVNVATLLIQLQDRSDRQLGQLEIMSRAREQLADLSHLKISVELVPRVSGGGFRAAPLQYDLRGADLGRLDSLSHEVMSRMREVAGIVDINSTYDAAKPEVSVDIDRERAATLGVSLEKLGKTVQTLVGGREVTTFEEGGETYDVRVRLVEPDRDRSDAIGQLPVESGAGAVELQNLVRVKEGTGPVQIDRQDRQRQITIMANLEPSKPLAEAMADVGQIEQTLGLPPDVTTAFTGFGDLMEESFANINFSLILAIVLIYMILAAQFESFVHPLTIMLSLPLSVCGALGGLALTGRTLNIFSMIGMIMLMGLVTKNAILLVDYTNQLRGGGLGKTEALLRAGPVRLRPILMTALSTVAGMLPLVLGLGSGAETRAPMGTCVVGGLITSTLLTLIVVPVMYSLLDDLGMVLKRRLPQGGEQENPWPRRRPPAPKGLHPAADSVTTSEVA